MSTSGIVVGIWIKGDQALDLDTIATACGSLARAPARAAAARCGLPGLRVNAVA